jgi:hypothetical protein
MATKCGLAKATAWCKVHAACGSTCGHAAAQAGTCCRAQVLALELLKVLLENAGPVFCGSERFAGAIKQYLCLSLLKNAASPVPAAQVLLLLLLHACMHACVLAFVARYHETCTACAHAGTQLS